MLMRDGIGRVLVLAPHTDDGELGCGASIARFVEEGADVFYAAFSTADQSLPEGLPPGTLARELRAATAVLRIPDVNVLVYDYEVRKLSYVRQEILERLVQLRDDVQPDLVFMPCPHDVHQDHSTVAAEGLRAFKKVSILGYELPWNTVEFSAQAFVGVTSEQVERKVSALSAYRSQVDKDYMQADFIRGWARMRGVQIGTRLAEAFEVIRWVIM
jgi:LmbE family N-acetylglucosaminyl deacetylase